ncbi:MAG: CotH kinase family protein [Verrucomicrobiales bacterium]|nr:CotH kinase family protein [Verrucomicrobiales bacterium]
MMCRLFRPVLLAVLVGIPAGFARAQSLVPGGATWSFFRGNASPSPADPAAWRLPDFDDASWEVGPEPFFYGEPLTGTELPEMRGVYSSVYVRRHFQVENPADYDSVLLKVLADDGFVAWINGQEVARFNVPEGDLGPEATALSTFSEPLSVEEYPINSPASVLRAGDNVLAIHGFNVSLGGSSDFVLNPSLEAFVDTSIPVVERVLPTPGAVVRDFSSVEIQFSRPVQGVDASDLVVNGTPATSRTEVSPGQFLFSFPPAPAGPVTVAFKPDHGIQDLASRPHPFAGGSWTFTVDPSAPGPGVHLNEFMADNDHTLRDENGDKSDWIELFNSDDRSISLQGWWLSDDPRTPRKWAFPATSIPSKGFLVVFASGKDRTSNPARLHTNFKLKKEAGASVVLSDPSGATVSSITNYPAQLEDVSYGRAPGALNLVGYFPTPTPGKPNLEQGPGFAPPVEFSETSRSYRGELTLTLSTTNAAAVIRYTTNGTPPSATSLKYDGPLVLATAVQVRACSFLDPLLPGPIHSETFVPLADPVAAFTSDLPVLLIHHFDKGRPPANVDSYASIQLYEPDTNGVTSLTNAPTLASRAVISARGSSTEGLTKVSMKVEFQDELGFGRDVDLLGMPADPDWVLYAPNNFEPILIHNPFAHQLSRDVGRYSPRTRFVEVYLVQKGFGPVAQANYFGIYVLEEKIKLGKDRVDAPKLFPGQDVPPEVTGGYLMKIDRPDPGDFGFFAANQGVLYVSPKEEEILQPDRSSQRTYLQDYMDGFGNALYGEQYRNPLTGYRAFIHVGSWIDHHLLNVLTFNVDALRLSAYFYKQRDGKLHFGPLWDFDRALYSTDGRDSQAATWRSTQGDLGTDFFNYPWWDRLFTDPDFFQAYIDRYQELRRDQFSTTNLNRLVDDLTSQVRKAQPREYNKWHAEPRGGGYDGEIRLLKSWLGIRTKFMDSQFVSPPSFPVPGATISRGTQVTIEFAETNTVYYTLDGTDPRAQGTATGNDIAPGALQYTGPITVNANVRIVARARNPQHTARTGPNNPPLLSIWSGPVAETYVVDPIPVRVTEVMFHPEGDGAGTGFNDEDFEFLELQNTGDQPVDLTGFALEGTVDFNFAETNDVRSIPAKGRILLVGNRDAFTQRYPLAGPIAGVLEGRMNNDSGRLALFGRLREPVFDFHYFEDWQPSADGAGDSLVLREESSGPLPPGDAASWRASSRSGGSPAVADPPPVVVRAALEEGILRIRLTGQAGRSYTLQGRETLRVGSWQTIDTQAASGDGSVVFSVVPTAESRLFQILLP